MRTVVKPVIVVGFGVWLALFASSTAAVAQLSGGSVSPTAGAASPTPVASGQSATSALSATTTSPTVSGEGCYLNAPTWSWAADGSPSGVSIDQYDGDSSPAATLTATFTSPGTYSVTATATATWTDSCGNQISVPGSTSPIVFTVVGVQGLQYLQSGNGYVNASGTLYVLLNQSVSFQAVPTPNGSSFPSNQPVWGGTSNATGTGPTVNVAFNTLSTSTSDYKTVTAFCGNTSVTTNVVVFDLSPILTPEDNFDGRDLDNYGVCELIDLSYSTTPSGIAASDIGGLQWQITSGGGSLTDGGDGEGTYQCPDGATTVYLSLLMTGGPMLGAAKAAPVRPIVPPAGVFMEQKPGTGLKHDQGFVTVGFQALTYATCTNLVSFAQIEVRGNVSSHCDWILGGVEQSRA